MGETGLPSSRCTHPLERPSLPHPLPVRATATDSRLSPRTCFSRRHNTLSHPFCRNVALPTETESTGEALASCEWFGSGLDHHRCAVFAAGRDAPHSRCLIEMRFRDAVPESETKTTAIAPPPRGRWAPLSPPPPNGPLLCELAERLPLRRSKSTPKSPDLAVTSHQGSHFQGGERAPCGQQRTRLVPVTSHRPSTSSEAEPWQQSEAEPWHQRARLKTFSHSRVRTDSPVALVTRKTDRDWKHRLARTSPTNALQLGPRGPGAIR